MKRAFITFIAISTLPFVACNNSGTSSKEAGVEQTSADSPKAEKKADTSITEVTPAFHDVDPKLAASLKTVVQHYLHIKNALVSNNGDEAANGGKAMAEAMSKIDKSLFTAEQKKIYDDIEDDLKEHAEHISENAGNIKHQREHFVMMSEDAYDLAKSFGTGQTLYHDHCPMANENKGAMWLSETQEVRNPYFGGKMNECVKVQEVIK